MLQIFGFKKCSATRKAERFFKERGVPFQSIDLAQKAMSPGELDTVAAALGFDVLIDKTSARYKERGLAYMDFDPREVILADMGLLATPVVRLGKKAAAGLDEDSWKELALAAKL